MAERILKPKPLTAERFAPYGDVIAAGEGPGSAMNAARFLRFDDLAAVDVDPAGDGHVRLSIARSRTATALPWRFDLVERHPLGSQAFVPLGSFVFVVVVGPPAAGIEAEDLEAFVTNGRQGVNYRRGTWHMPLIALESGQEFLVVDRGGSQPNCDEHVLADAVVLEAP